MTSSTRFKDMLISVLEKNPVTIVFKKTSGDYKVIGSAQIVRPSNTLPLFVVRDTINGQLNTINWDNLVEVNGMNVG